MMESKELLALIAAIGLAFIIMMAVFQFALFTELSAIMSVLTP